jgi:hypothetical protein
MATITINLPDEVAAQIAAQHMSQKQMVDGQASEAERLISSMPLLA